MGLCKGTDMRVNSGAVGSCHRPLPLMPICCERRYTTDHGLGSCSQAPLSRRCLYQVAKLTFLVTLTLSSNLEIKHRPTPSPVS